MTDAPAGTPRQCHVSVTARDGGVTLHIDGDMDMINADSLWSRFEQAIHESEGDVMLDLERCRFIDSSGLRVVIRAAKLLNGRGRKLGVRRARPGVREVFRLTGLSRFRLLDLHEDGAAP